MIVYQFTNKVNGKSYIGQTVHSLEKRTREHLSPRSGCVVLYKAIQKYGLDNMERKVLVKVGSTDELNYYESALIKAFNTLSPNGYNLMTGGDRSRPVQSVIQKRNETCKDPQIREKMGRHWREVPFTEEHCQKISDALKGRQFSSQHRKKLSKSAKGRVMPPVSDDTRQRLSEAATKMWKTRPKVFKKHTPEAIEKIREASTGRKHTEEAKAKISRTRLEKGFRHTQEVLDKISQSRKGQMTGEKHPMYGKTHSDEAKQKISAAGKGRKHSVEARQKISEASKKMWEQRSRVVPYKPRPSTKGRIPWNKGNAGFRFLEKTQN